MATIDRRCPGCNCKMFNGLSLELDLCRNCRGDIPGGSNYISKKVLIESSRELEIYGRL